MAEPATDYTLTPRQAEFLADVCMLPADLRLKAIKGYRRRHGVDQTLQLLCQFIGAANAAVAHNQTVCAEALRAAQREHVHG